MIHTVIMTLVFVFFAGTFLNAGVGDDHYQPFELKDISEDSALVCLKNINCLMSKEEKTPNEIFSVYRSEESISNFIVNFSPDPKDSTWNKLPEDKNSVKYKCILYVRENLSRFREIYDGWKEEENLWEPNYYWLEILKEKYPGSKERWLIEWDLDYKNFIRQFELALPYGKCGTCDEYYDGLISEYPEYLEHYKQDEIIEIKKDCELKRKHYKVKLNELLNKYKDIKIEKKMYEIDEKCIVSNKYFGLC